MAILNTKRTLLGMKLDKVTFSHLYPGFVGDFFFFNCSLGPGSFSGEWGENEWQLRGACL